MISKTKEIMGDIDIKNFTVSPLNHNACTFLHLESVSRHDACRVSHELALDATAEEEETFEIL